MKALLFDNKKMFDSLQAVLHNEDIPEPEKRMGFSEAKKHTPDVDKADANDKYEKYWIKNHDKYFYPGTDDEMEPGRCNDDFSRQYATSQAAKGPGLFRKIFAEMKLSNLIKDILPF